jgi:hypothetical protein
VLAVFDKIFNGEKYMRKHYGVQCRNCYRLVEEGTQWCDTPNCQKIKGDLEAGRIYDTLKRGPHNATGEDEFTFVIFGRPDLSCDNTVWAFVPRSSKRESLPVPSDGLVA